MVHTEQINLIPYHNTGSGKYVHLGREYKGGMFYAPPKERMQELQRLMEIRILRPFLSEDEETGRRYRKRKDGWKWKNGE